MKAYVDKDKCVGCGICADECPAGAVKVGDIALVDASLCTGCGACVDACPAEALSMK
jgi:ferredoxin